MVEHLFLPSLTIQIYDKMEEHTMNLNYYRAGTIVNDEKSELVIEEDNTNDIFEREEVMKTIEKVKGWPATC